MRLTHMRLNIRHAFTNIAGQNVITRLRQRDVIFNKILPELRRRAEVIRVRVVIVDVQLGDEDPDASQVWSAYPSRCCPVACTN